MTLAHRGKAEATPFSHWLRGLPGPYDSRSISNQNLDYVWHNYRENWLITIEEKRYGVKCPFAQYHTHNIVRQLLENGCKTPVQTARGERLVDYRSHYVVRFERTTPDDGWILINDKPATRDDLLTLLRTGSVPPPRLRAVPP